MFVQRCGIVVMLAGLSAHTVPVDGDSPCWIGGNFRLGRHDQGLELLHELGVHLLFKRRGLVDDRGLRITFGVCALILYGGGSLNQLFL